MIKLLENIQKNNNFSFNFLRRSITIQKVKSFENFDVSLQSIYSKSSNLTTKCGGSFGFKNSNVINITSPNYPYQYNTNIRCNYLIKVKYLFKKIALNLINIQKIEKI